MLSTLPTEGRLKAVPSGTRRVQGLGGGAPSEPDFSPEERSAPNGCGGGTPSASDEGTGKSKAGEGAQRPNKCLQFSYK